MTAQSHGHVRKHVHAEQYPTREPANAHLRGIKRTSQRSHPLDRPAAYDPDTDEPIAFFSAWCAHLTTRMLGGGARLTDADLAPVRDVAFRWVRGAVTLEEALKACHTGARRSTIAWFDGPASRAAGAGVEAAEVALDILGAATGAVAAEYTAAGAGMPTGLAPRDVLAAALAQDRTNITALSRECRVTIAMRYHVLSIELAAAQPHRADSETAEFDHNRRRSGLQGAVADTFGVSNDILVDVTTGRARVFVPFRYSQGDIDRFIARVAVAVGGGPVFGVRLDSPIGEMAETLAFADELAELATALGRERKMHRVSELVLEYQMSRPGPVRDTIRSILDPLREHPALLETITTYVNLQQNRKLSARTLFVHTNTLDSRLKRISQLLGFNVASVRGQRNLEAAVFVEDLMTQSN